MVNCSALRINELEANPEGDDAGFEWIELYSEEMVDLEGYVLDHEGRGAVINLSGSFQGYFVINLQNQWLRNNNETVYLKNGDDLIDSVGPFSDNKKEKTYSFCDGQWEFTSSSENEANLCETPQNTQSNQEVRQNESIPSRNNVEEINVENTPNTTRSNEIVNQAQNPKKILLNSQPNYEITRTYKIRTAVIYFFIGFCVLLVILIALKKL